MRIILITKVIRIFFSKLKNKKKQVKSTLKESKPVAIVGEEFHKIANTRGYQDGIYPHSEKSYRYFKILVKILGYDLLLLSLIFFVLGLRWCYEKFFAFENIIDLPIVDIVISPHSLMLMFFSSILSIIKYAIFFTFPIIFLFMVIYFQSIVRRQRNFERNVLKNDIKSYMLKHDILKKMQVKQQLKEVLASSKSGTDLSLSTQAKKLALETILSMNCRINSRQSLTGNHIDNRYYIQIDLPYIEAASNEVETLLKNLPTICTNVMENKVSFGDIQKSENRKYLSLFAINEEPDPYYYEISNGGEVVEKIVYTSTFPITLLNDNRAKIANIKESSKKWAADAGASLDTLFATTGINVNRINFDVGNSSVLYKYSKPYSTEKLNYERLPDVIDSNFKFTGTSIQLVAGNLEVTLPLPQELRVPIDVPTMWQDAFGLVE